jgi:hypothetical protein
MYESYLDVIANAVERFGKATATMHEKWSKFLVRDVPTWLTQEAIREEIETKYPGPPNIRVPSLPRSRDGYYPRKGERAVAIRRCFWR